MNFKPFMLLAILAVLSLGAFGRPTVHAAPQVHSPLTVNQESAPAQAVCATIPLFDVDEWAQTNKPAITGAEAQQIAEVAAAPRTFRAKGKDRYGQASSPPRCFLVMTGKTGLHLQHVGKVAVEVYNTRLAPFPGYHLTC